MIGVSCPASSNRPDQVASLDSINCRAANARLSFFGQAAWTHPAQFAAHTGTTDIAGSHVISPAESGADAELISSDQHLLCSGID
jgi:hypothetical protein